MQKIEIVRNCIQAVRKSGEHVNTESVIIASLFQPNGTLTEDDADLINEEFSAIRTRIEAKINRAYPYNTGAFVSGLAYGVAVNDYFNYKAPEA